MQWLTQTIITLTPLSLAVLLCAAMCLGWVIYGLRGYKHWFRRFHRYSRIPSRRSMRKNYGYVEYIPEVVNRPIMPRPQARAPQIIHKHIPAPMVTQATTVAAPMNIPIGQSPKPVYSTKDDLCVIEGVGPKVEEILNSNGIYTWRELTQTPTQNITTMLERAGLTKDPATWPQQAHMADTGQWDELKAYQDILHT